MKWWLLGLTMIVSTACAEPLYLELDGAYYTVTPGSTIEYEGSAWVAPQTSMIGCDRGNNQIQQFSDFALLYGANLDIVYLSTIEVGSSYFCVGSATDEACVLAMISTTGDIVCGGAVAAPDPIFANGFDSP